MLLNATHIVKHTPLSLWQLLILSTTRNAALAANPLQPAPQVYSLFGSEPVFGMTAVMRK